MAQKFALAAKKLLDNQGMQRHVQDCQQGNLETITIVVPRGATNVPPVISGNMSMESLKAIVNNLSEETKISNPVIIPKCPFPYDVLCSNLEAMRKYALLLKSHFLPGRKGLGKGPFEIWTKKVDTTQYCLSAKVNTFLLTLLHNVSTQVGLTLG